MLAEEKCTPPQAGDPPMEPEEAARLHREIPDWTLTEFDLQRQFKFAGFPEALVFVNQVAEIAQAENHHPDICLYYNRVELKLSTHKVGGLSRNDFILAAKIDQIS